MPKDTEIINLEEKVWEAVIAKDGNHLNDVFADDYCEITVDGMRYIKGEVAAGSPKVDQIYAYSMSNTRVTFLEPSVALLNYKLVLSGKLRDKPISPTDRWVVSLWKLTDSGWKCAYFQQTAFQSDGEKVFGLNPT